MRLLFHRLSICLAGLGHLLSYHKRTIVQSDDSQEDAGKLPQSPVWWSEGDDGLLSWASIAPRCADAGGGSCRRLTETYTHGKYQ